MWNFPMNLTIVIITTIVVDCEAATHWIVTENGMIQTLMSGSPMSMRRPYDLIAVMEQEKRWTRIQTMFIELRTRKSRIEEKLTNLQRFSRRVDASSGGAGADSLSECNFEGPATDYSGDTILYRAFVTNGTDRLPAGDADVTAGFLENVHERAILEMDGELPKCTKYTAEYAGETLESVWGLPPFEHLFQTDSNDSEEEYLRDFLPCDQCLDSYGYEIDRELWRNTTSWFHYNLATLFWRIKGNNPEALDCNKRALYFAPSNYRDIPLHNLAGLLHKLNSSDSAAKVLLVAIKSVPKQPIHQLALGYVYSSLGNYSASVRAFDNFLKLRPNKHVAKMRQITACLQQTASQLNEFQANVGNVWQLLKIEVKEYHSIQNDWLQLANRMLAEHASTNSNSASISNYGLEVILPMEMLQVLGVESGGEVEEGDDNNNNGRSNSRQKCQESGEAILCDNHTYNYDGVVPSDIQDMDYSNLQHLFNLVELETKKLTQGVLVDSSILPNGAQESSSNSGLPPPIPSNVYMVGAAPIDAHSTNYNMYFDAPDWPPKDTCELWDLPVQNQEDVDLPVFLPPENKGYNIEQILGDAIDLSSGVEHELPWHPPNCPDPGHLGEKLVATPYKPSLNLPLHTNDYLKGQLFKYVKSSKVADMAEIGQRIVTAIDKNVAPKWLLYNLAALYWRIRGKPIKALQCLAVAKQNVTATKRPHADITLVGVASVLHQLGATSAAIKYAHQAYKLDHVEPATNFLLAILHYNTNVLEGIYYMKSALRVAPHFYGGIAEQLLKLWACRIKLGYVIRVAKNAQGAGVLTTVSSTGNVGGSQVGSILLGSGSAGGGGSGITLATPSTTTTTGVGGGGGGNSPPIMEQCATSKHTVMETRVFRTHTAAAAVDGGGEQPFTVQTLTAMGGANFGGGADDSSSNENSGPIVCLHNNNKKHIGDFSDLLPGPSKISTILRNHIGEYYVDVNSDAHVERMLKTADKRYLLTIPKCKRIKDVDWYALEAMHKSVDVPNYGVGDVLRTFATQPHHRAPTTHHHPHHHYSPHAHQQASPHCSDEVSVQRHTVIDELCVTLSPASLANVEDRRLALILMLLAEQQPLTTANLVDVGTRISLALQANSTSWKLANTAAIYWLAMGNSAEAIICLRIALGFAPDELTDFPLVSLANLLLRLDYAGDALVVGYLAISVNNKSVLSFFTVGTILEAMGDAKEAIGFYRQSLILDPNFEPARNRLKSALCTLFFIEIGIMKPVLSSE